jgi:multidrug efflux system outer membrane protein
MNNTAFCKISPRTIPDNPVNPSPLRGEGKGEGERVGNQSSGSWFPPPLSPLPPGEGRVGVGQSPYRSLKRDLLTLVSGIALFLLTGCMVGPNYQRPAVEVPKSWRVEAQGSKDVVNTLWWEQFNDPVLNDLIQIALQENMDVKIAAARVEQFLGQYGTTRSALFPQVGVSASAGRQRLSQTMGPVPYQLDNSINTSFDTYEIFVSASWEIDLWGKIRRATEAARANLLSTEEARRTVILTLVTAVANSYVNLRDLDKQLELTVGTAKSYKETYDLFSLRFKHGIVSETEVNQAKAQYEQALANIPVFQKAIAQQENALCVLLGRNPGPIPRGRTIDELTLPAVPVGLPSDLLMNRPDIRQAEEDLVAANANIGVAKALYYPVLSLTGLFGFASMDLSNLFQGPSRIWSYAAPVTAPIFTAGAIEGQVKSAEAVQQQTLWRYRQVIQTAFQEVDDSLVDHQRTMEQLGSLSRETAALREYVRLAWLRYNNGYTSYLEVLYSQTLLYNAEILHATAQGTLFQALVNLYKSMGGGWVVEAENKTAAGQ